MPQKILKSVLSLILSLFILLSLTFALLHFVPGGPFDQAQPLPPEVKANLLAKYQLDQPLTTRYFAYLKNILQGDLGPSIKYAGRSVSSIIVAAFPVSFLLGICSLLLSIALAIPLAIVAARNRKRWMDLWISAGAIAGAALPIYLLAAILIYIFNIYLKILPAALWQDWTSLILPTLAMSIKPTATIFRFLRLSLIENMGQDFVRSARARGIAENILIYKHALKNSFVPVLSIMGPLAATLLAGSFVVEYVFSLPGLGKHFIMAAYNRDSTLLMGLTLVMGSLILFFNFCVDISYGLFDPRMRGRK